MTNLCEDDPDYASADEVEEASWYEAHRDALFRAIEAMRMHSDTIALVDKNVNTTNNNNVGSNPRVYADERR